MSAFVRAVTEDHVATLTLARPDLRNAVSPPLSAELAEAISVADADGDVRAIVLTGEGPIFSAGGDLKGLKEGAGSPEMSDEAGQLAAALEPARRLLACSKPSVALIRGAAAGGGLALALACDFRIAAVRTKLAYAYGRIGLAGDLGATWLLADLLGPRRAFRFAIAPYLDAAAACAIGLVDEVVQDDALEEAGETIIGQVLATPPLAMAAIKANLRAAGIMDFDGAARLEAESFRRLRRTADHREAIAAFLERRPPHFTGD